MSIQNGGENPVLSRPSSALVVASFALIAALGAWTASPARAAFPGQNGKIAFASERAGLDDEEVFSMNADGTGQTNLTQVEPGTDAQPAWSPDGQRIAFASNRDGDREIFVMNADGSGQTPLTSNTADDSQPAWSPDGTRIAFSSDRSTISAEIFVMNADGTAQTPLTSNTAPEGQPAFSPDGSKIVFGSSRDGNNEIYVMNADGSAQTRLTNNPASDQDIDISPDGTEIAFASTRDGQLEIYTMQANGSDQTRLTNDVATDNSPAWSPDGQKIAFATTRVPGGSEIFAMNADGTAPTNLSNDDGADRDPNWGGSGDSDGDALPDAWEEDGVDVDGDGAADLDLPAMGADPDHKDIFAEVDHMPGHRIPDAQINRVAQAFADAPVANPDGQTGITLHVDNGSGSVMNPPTGATWGAFSDQEEVPHQNVLGTEFGDDEYDWSQFESLRQTRFAAARRPVFHYAIAAHSGPDNDFSGIAQGIPGGDFLIMAHETCVPSQPVAVECTPDPDAQATTFMHELGHTLGLRHGGGDNLNRKPNYLSVMNYNFGFGLRQFTGVGNQTEFALDYSQFAIPLDERSLDEQHAFPISSGPATAYQTLYRCPGSGTRRGIPVLDTPVDWSCNGQIATFLITTDITTDGERTHLPGAIDWDRLVFDGGAVGDLAEPPAPDTTPLDEPTPEEMIAAQEALAAGPVDDSGLPREPVPESDPPADPPANPPIDPAAEPPADPPADPPDEPKPRNDFTLGKVKKNKRNGTAKLTVIVPGPGTLELAKAKTVKADETQAEAAGDATLLVKPKGKAKKRLNRRGRAKLSVEVTYSPNGGDPNTKARITKLVKK